MKTKAAVAKQKEMKAKTAATKHNELKAKAAAATVASKQHIASEFRTPSLAAKGSVHATTISTDDLPTCPTHGVDCGPGQEST